MTQLRIAFMGTPDFAVPTLKALVDAGHEVIAVYSQPPRPAGRGQKERPSPVAMAAGDLGIPVFTPLSFKHHEDVARFEGLKLDVAVVVAYGLILPKPILNAPRHGCVNVHASLLPRWRGAAPIQRAIMAGDKATGVTIMAMDEGLDTGAMILSERTPISLEDTAQTLHDRLSHMGAALINPALEGLVDGSLRPRAQPADGVTYAKKIDKAEARIDWARSPAEIHGLIRGLSPFPGAWDNMNGQRIKILMAELLADHDKGDAAPGTILDDQLTVACDYGAIRPSLLQREGKGPLKREDFLRGFPIAAGNRFG